MFIDTKAQKLYTDGSWIKFVLPKRGIRQADV
jgi:hypothetical protein